MRFKIDVQTLLSNTDYPFVLKSIHSSKFWRLGTPQSIVFQSMEHAWKHGRLSHANRA